VGPHTSGSSATIIHRLIGKIAAVSDSPVLSTVPQLAKHFVKAEIRHFNANERATALAWLRQ
jgi:hypothetical protein